MNMDNKPLVSVIIPVYNGEKYINKSLDSIIFQSYSNLEIIVVNDGSSDGTKNILDHYEDRRLKIIEQENAGVSAARNAGIGIASGKYIVFCDDDDFYENDFVEVAVNLAEKHPHSWILFGNYTLERTDDLVETNILEDSEYLDKHDGYTYAYFKSISGYCWGKIYSSDVIKNNSIYFDASYQIGEDVIFNINYLNCVSNVITSSRVAYHYYSDRGVTSKLSDTFDIDVSLYRFRINNINAECISKFKVANFQQFERSLKAIWGTESSNSTSDKLKRSNEIIRSEEFQECLKECVLANQVDRRSKYYKIRNYEFIYVLDFLHSIKCKIFQCLHIRNDLERK